MFLVISLTVVFHRGDFRKSLHPQPPVQRVMNGVEPRGLHGAVGVQTHRARDGQVLRRELEQGRAPGRERTQEALAT